MHPVSALSSLFTVFSEFQRLQLEQELDVAGISQKIMYVALLCNVVKYFVITHVSVMQEQADTVHKKHGL